MCSVKSSAAQVQFYCISDIDCFAVFDLHVEMLKRLVLTRLNRYEKTRTQARIIEISMQYLIQS